MYAPLLTTTREQQNVSSIPRKPKTFKEARATFELMLIAYATQEGADTPEQAMKIAEFMVRAQYYLLRIDAIREFIRHTGGRREAHELVLKVANAKWMKSIKNTARYHPRRVKAMHTIMHHIVDCNYGEMLESAWSQLQSSTAHFQEVKIPKAVSDKFRQKMVACRRMNATLQKRKRPATRKRSRKPGTGPLISHTMGKQLYAMCNGK